MTIEEQKEFFKAFTKEQEEIMLSKGGDYAGEEDRLLNFKVAGACAGGDAQTNCLQIIGTKVARLGTLFNNRKKGKAANNESIFDSIIDLANYAALLAMIEHENNERKTK